MKKELKKLELKKLFKEFGFLKIDEEYKKEIQDLYGPEFQKEVQKFFKENPDLDLLFNTQPQPNNNHSNTHDLNEKNQSDNEAVHPPDDESDSGNNSQYRCNNQPL